MATRILYHPGPSYLPLPLCPRLLPQRPTPPARRSVPLPDDGRHCRRQQLVQLRCAGHCEGLLICAADGELRSSSCYAASGLLTRGVCFRRSACVCTGRFWRFSCPWSRPSWCLHAHLTSRAAVSASKALLTSLQVELFPRRCRGLANSIAYNIALAIFGGLVGRRQLLLQCSDSASGTTYVHCAGEHVR
jgi:hypothetical protein